MKKLLFAIGSIAAMIIVSSCSADSLEDTKNQNAINKNQISPSLIQDTIPVDTLSLDNIPAANNEPIDNGNPPRP